MGSTLTRNPAGTPVSALYRRRPQGAFGPQEVRHRGVAIVQEDGAALIDVRVLLELVERLQRRVVDVVQLTGYGRDALGDEARVRTQVHERVGRGRERRAYEAAARDVNRVRLAAHQRAVHEQPSTGHSRKDATIECPRPCLVAVPRVLKLQRQREATMVRGGPVSIYVDGQSVGTAKKARADGPRHRLAL